MVHKKQKGIVLRSAYLGFNMANVGGYSFDEPEKNIHGSADFIDNNLILKLSKKKGLSRVHLAGDWSGVGKKGYGEIVSIEEAERLLKKKKEIDY